MLHWQGQDTTAAKIVPFVKPSREGSSSVADIFGGMAARMHFPRNAEIFGEDEPADCIYKVVRGAVRTSKLMSDGRRQIGAFFLQGDMFGLESEGVRAFAAEAVVDSIVLVVKRRAFIAEATRQNVMITELWQKTMEHLQRAQAHMLLLGRKTAQERIAAFLLEMASRLKQSGELELPMSRQDIADYLGLTIETVSRTLTQFERAGLIGIPEARRIVLRNRCALDMMNDCLAA